MISSHASIRVAYTEVPQDKIPRNRPDGERGAHQSYHAGTTEHTNRLTTPIVPLSEHWISLAPPGDFSLPSKHFGKTLLLLPPLVSRLNLAYSLAQLLLLTTPFLHRFNTMKTRSTNQKKCRNRYILSFPKKIVGYDVCSHDRFAFRETRDKTRSRKSLRETRGAAGRAGRGLCTSLIQSNWS